MCDRKSVYVLVCVCMCTSACLHGHVHVGRRYVLFPYMCVREMDMHLDDQSAYGVIAVIMTFQKAPVGSIKVS